jgi:hypothetical protein
MNLWLSIKRIHSWSSINLTVSKEVNKYYEAN